MLPDRGLEQQQQMHPGLDLSVCPSNTRPATAAAAASIAHVTNNLALYMLGLYLHCAPPWEACRRNDRVGCDYFTYINETQQDRVCGVL